MAICPFAVQQLIPETRTQGRIKPTTVILHRAVSSADSLRDYWNSPGVEVESHFYVGKTGIIYQFVDTEVRADANVSANGFAVSIETWDGGNTPDSMEWNPAQVAAIKRLVAWICDTHGIAKRAATAWNSGGVGGHNWFATEWAGGPRGCPGTARNNQIRNDIIPAVASGNLEEEDMNQAQDAALAETWDAVGRKGAGGKPVIQLHIEFVVEELTRRLDARLAPLRAEIAALKASGIPVKAEVDVPTIAKAVNDEGDRRDRDGDPRTGSVS